MRFALLALLVACGPSSTAGDDMPDPNEPCKSGETAACYTGQDGTKGVGPCQGGMRTCDAGGTWSQCVGEIVPAGESCADGVDNNCNGLTDEDQDLDGDGITTCAGDCCDSTECSAPKLVNAGAFDAPGNNVDDDCDGSIDNTQLACDANIFSDSSVAMDFARALDLCQTTTMPAKKWGVLSAALTLADGTGIPASKARAIRPRFGFGVMPRGGSALALLSTGAAAAKNDTNPSYQNFQETPSLGGNETSSAFPADFLAANGGKLPNAPGCPMGNGTIAMDPIMLTLTIRVPTNARSFTLDTNFFSSEFPEYICSPFNDFFVVLLDSTYTGSPANPADKNLAFYQPPSSTQKYPVGVNLATNNTGLFTQCRNGHISCRQVANQPLISTCVGTSELANTGFDTPDPGWCDSNSLQGGGTGWLQTSGNVVPGEIIKVRIAIWDTSDHLLDSIAAIDAFKWSVDVSQPGTILY